VLHYFIFDLLNPNSILSCWKGARENARAVRDLLASEIWERLNVSYLELQEWSVERVLAESPHHFFERVEGAAHLLHGTIDRTLLVGETKDWMDIGRFLERASQTERLLDVKYNQLLPAQPPDPGSSLSAVQDAYGVGGALDVHGWIAVLKSVSAFEMFRKTRRDGISPASVVDFLLLRPDFAASVRYCVGRVETALRQISGSRRDEPSNAVERGIGRLKADLTYADPNEVIMAGLHGFLAGVQSRLAEIDDAIVDAYLSY
jgi:uncharacterized alpha-E superfamily protein